MNLLQYTSEEMYSSTDLIRKSKMIFEKLQKRKIEKAIILRDGKPGFMLLDFETYEKLMTEYISLKESLDKKDNKKSSIKNDINLVESENKIEDKAESITQIEELTDEDLESALHEIDNLDLSTLENNEIKDEKPLKEFWE
jgi:seryl-tRNA synthetase